MGSPARWFIRGYSTTTDELVSEHSVSIVAFGSPHAASPLVTVGNVAYFAECDQ